jgi:hypothetical protein
MKIQVHQVSYELLDRVESILSFSGEEVYWMKYHNTKYKWFMFACVLVFMGATVTWLIKVNSGQSVKSTQVPRRVDQGQPICPAESFRLPIAEIPKMEFAALHDGDVKAAIRLSCHYGIYLNKPCIGEIWRFRAAQLGNINATRSLSERGLLDGGRRSYFLKATESTAFAELSGIAQRYILFHAKDRRKNNVSSDGSTDFTIRNLDVEPAIVRTGSVNAMFCRDSSVLSWPMEYIAYKARCREGGGVNEVADIVVFPSFDGMCQKAVDVAEERSLPWIVVAIDIEDHFRCRPKEVSLEECCRCTCKVLELVFADFSLPRSTIVRFAESVTFARQMEPMTKGSFMVMQAPSYLMCRR